MRPVTVAEAVGHLHPRVSRRTLGRIIESAGLKPIGVRRSDRGRPAIEYDLAEINKAHTAWFTGVLTCAGRSSCP